MSIIKTGDSNDDARATSEHATTVETSHSVATSELATRDGMTQDIHTVGESRDPITGNPAPLHGIMVEFEETEPLLKAANAAREAGYTRMDAYSPIPVEGLTAAMGWRDKMVPRLMLLGGFIGCTGGFLLQYAGMKWFYPLNIGGKPLGSWPQFIVPAFEMTIYFTAVTGVLSMILLNGLPSPYHPVFNVPEFEGASSDRFFLCIESDDPRFDRAETMQFLRGLGGVRVAEVPK